MCFGGFAVLFKFQNGDVVTEGFQMEISKWPARRPDLTPDEIIFLFLFCFEISQLILSPCLSWCCIFTSCSLLGPPHASPWPSPLDVATAESPLSIIRISYVIKQQLIMKIRIYLAINWDRLYRGVRLQNCKFPKATHSSNYYWHDTRRKKIAISLTI